MRSLKQKVCITINAYILKKVIDLAEKSDRSVSRFINLVLRD